MASIRCALVPSALVCMAMFLQGCGILDQLHETALAAFVTLKCGEKIDIPMLSVKNNSLTALAKKCENASVVVKCLEDGSELIGNSFVRVKENLTATCAKYVLDLEKLENVSDLTDMNTTISITNKTKAWTDANMGEQSERFGDVLKLCIDFAYDPTVDIEEAEDRINEFSGQVTPESKAFGQANKEVLAEFAMSGGNKIQAMSTSHAGRWVASACSLLMVMAGVFRFSRRAWLTPHSTGTEKLTLVDDEDVEGRCEHIAE